MKKLLLLDTGIFFIAAVAAFLKEDLTLVVDIIGFTGLIFFVMAGVLSGSFLSGNRIRVNYYTEDEEERREKRKLSLNLFYIGLINISISLLVYKFIQNQFTV